jgi:hypothetical protein
MSRTFTDTLREGSDFFMKRGSIYDTLRKITKRLRDENIDYVVLGAMALSAHGFRRFTEDVDLLTTPEGLDVIHKRLVGRGYVPAFPGARKKLRDTETGVTIDFISSGEYPGDGKPKPVRFPDPREASVERDGYNVITLPKLVELKLVAGLSAADRMKDLSDIQEFIKTVKLPRDLGEQLDPSVQNEYYRIWDASQIIHDPSAN